MSDELTWVRRGAVLVAVPTPDSPPDEPARKPLAELIACPTCHARVTERCKSATGTPRSPHVNRLAPRLCACGELLKSRKQMCDPCREQARAETYASREKRVPTRLRRKAA